ncbi:MAG: hypothetical protein RLN90_04040 [Balneolaceae bacterium]
MKKINLIMLFIIIVVQVKAQENPIEREGFVIGASAGMAFTSILGDTPNISDGASISLPNLKIGWMYNQDVALLITTPGLNYTRGDLDRSIDGIIPSVQYWVKPNWWVSGGLGLGIDSATIFDSNSSNDDTNIGTACQFSAGYEIYKKGRFTIDYQGVLFASNINNDWGDLESVSFLTGFGFNFY